MSRGASLSWVYYRRQQDGKWRHLRKTVQKESPLLLILCVILLLLYESDLCSVLYHLRFKTVLSTGGKNVIQFNTFLLHSFFFFSGMTMRVLHEFLSLLPFLSGCSFFFDLREHSFWAVSSS